MHHLPSVFRYQPCWELDRKSLRADKISIESIWTSKPDSLNDPLDMTPIYDELHIGMHDESLIKIHQNFAAELYHGDKYLKEMVTQNLRKDINSWVLNKIKNDELLDSFKTRIYDMGVACFSRNLNSPIMWAHYAGNGEGFILEYKIDEMKLAENNMKWHFIEMNYSTHSLKIGLNELLATPLPSMKRVFSAKTLPWSYENEWRLIYLGSGNSSQSIPIGMNLNSIILGAKSPQQQTELIKRKCRNWDINCYDFKNIGDKNHFIKQQQRIF